MDLNAGRVVVRVVPFLFLILWVCVGLVGFGFWFRFRFRFWWLHLAVRKVTPSLPMTLSSGTTPGRLIPGSSSPTPPPSPWPPAPYQTDDILLTPANRLTGSASFLLNCLFDCRRRRRRSYFRFFSVFFPILFFVYFFFSTIHRTPF